ncbi:MAG: type II toxin-antitoxin system HipA family toxin [Spirochaetaceae bacterium]|nr:MAG: type II toxin-antitoxin system HipA family toxin [Spirochaetaceae bacterium]
MRCFCCGKVLPAGSPWGSWHRRCSSAFFGTPVPPRLEISNRTLEDLASQAVSSGRTVPGVQRKLSIHLSRDGDDYRLTLVGYPAGYILKPPSPEYPNLPEIEFVTMGLAEIVGITTVPHGLVALCDGTVAYITRRIDRRVAHPYRVPMEDLCQLSQRLTDDKYRGSYEQIARIIRRYSSRPGVDLSEYFLMILFCFVVGNSDMHLKNFSLFRPDDLWVLSPAYDLVSTAVVIPDDPDETALTLSGKKRKLSRRDFESFGVGIGLDPRAVIGLIDRVTRSRDRLATAIAQSPIELPPAAALLDLIDERIECLR